MEDEIVLLVPHSESQLHLEFQPSLEGQHSMLLVGTGGRLHQTACPEVDKQVPLANRLRTRLPLASPLHLGGFRPQRLKNGLQLKLAHAAQGLLASLALPTACVVRPLLDMLASVLHRLSELWARSPEEYVL